MQAVGHANPAAPPIVYQHNVQLTTLSRSCEMRRILGERSSFRAPGQQSQKYTDVFHARNQLLNADACNMERRHRGSDICVAFVGADHEGSRFGDRKIAPSHARSRSQKSGTSVVSHDLSQKVGIIIVWIGTDGAREELSHVLP